MKSIKKLKNVLIISMVVLSLIFTVACNGKANDGGNAAQPNTQTEKKELSGTIDIDGSSTVYPISAAVAEEFSLANKGVKVNVGLSGTGGGMKKFYAGTIQICDASRPIKQKEIDEAKKNGIEYTEIKVAYDGLSIVVNKDNDWATSITVDELKKMWAPDSTVKTWKDVNPAWPDEAIKFYAPGTDSGTFEYFTEAVVGEAGAIRKDITPSEDDNVLVTGIANDKNAIGFFGYAYYEENKATLKALSVDAGKGAVDPTFETIKDGTYAPLSRPLFMYVNNKSLQDEHVKSFVKYYLTEGVKVIPDVGYVPLESYDAELAKIK